MVIKNLTNILLITEGFSPLPDNYNAQIAKAICYKKLKQVTTYPYDQIIVGQPSWLTITDFSKRGRLLTHFKLII
jgi:hypothetical protein